MNVSYNEVPAHDVTEFFVKGYKMPDGIEVKYWEAFYDPLAEVYIFKLTTGEVTTKEPTIKPKSTRKRK